MTGNDKRRLFVSPDFDLQDVARCEQPELPMESFRSIYRFGEWPINRLLVKLTLSLITLIYKLRRWSGTHCEENGGTTPCVECWRWLRRCRTGANERRRRDAAWESRLSSAIRAILLKSPMSASIRKIASPFIKFGRRATWAAM
jgi:hypothetical protein